MKPVDRVKKLIKRWKIDLMYVNAERRYSNQRTQPPKIFTQYIFSMKMFGLQRESIEIMSQRDVEIVYIASQIKTK